MSSDNQYTALGPAIVGFQTDSASIDRGAEIAGNSLGILGSCNQGNGVHGKSGSPTDSGVWGENSGHGFGVAGSSAGVGVVGCIPGGVSLGPGIPSVGVWGTTVAPDTFAESTDGILGEGKNGVHGRSRSPTDSGVWGENTSSGFGVAGSSVSGEGVLGQGGTNGVHGQSGSPTDSGVWGENTGAVFGGVPRSSGLGGKPSVVGVWGTTVQPGSTADSADGILGEGKNGVHGRSRSPTDSGVWGENTRGGVGVAGSSATGYGGQFTGGFAQLYLTPSATTGIPTSGNHKRGEFFVDSKGSLFFCKGDGVPGTSVQLA
jgi:hypothetical protein